MLFYNHKHEFIGIDEDGLKLLNYATLEDLLGVCGDVADLFAKEPGYIHNFKSFGWIDFLLHADSDARSAIVHAHGKTFSCTLTVHSFFLCAEPGQTGYMIDMTHIQSISGDDIKPHTITPKAQPEFKQAPVATPAPVESITDVLPDYAHITPTTLTEPGTLDVPSNIEEFEPVREPEEDLYAKLSLPLSDEELHKELPAAPIIEERIERPMLGDVHYSHAEKEFLETLKVDKAYRFDPNVAAHELGLPVDLIQEFIGDFIQQSYEFKDELFEAVHKGDSNNIKILSHKLKGVAANLRIEDAFETLSIINTSNDSVEIEANLKYFYTIIAKLEGKETPEVAENVPFFKAETVEPPVSDVQISAPAQLAAAKEEDDDIYAFMLKEEVPAIVEKKEEAVSDSLDDEDFFKPLSNESFEDTLSINLDDSEETNTAAEFPTPPLHYDKVFIAGQLGIEHDFFDELIDEYKRDALTSGKAITAAIGAFDTHAWKKAAIQLKGISDNLRLSEISDELAILSQTNDAQEANKAAKRLNSFIEQL